MAAPEPRDQHLAQQPCWGCKKADRACLARVGSSSINSDQGFAALDFAGPGWRAALLPADAAAVGADSGLTSPQSLPRYFMRGRSSSSFLPMGLERISRAKKSRNSQGTGGAGFLENRRA